MLAAPGVSHILSNTHSMRVAITPSNVAMYLLRYPTPCTSLDFYFELESSQAPPRSHEHETSCQHHDATENLQMQILAVLVRHQCTTNRVTDQCSETDDCEHGASPYADLSDVGDLGHQGWSERDEGTATKAVKSGEEDVGDVAACRKPERENKNRAEEGGDHHGIEAPNFVGDVARNSTTKDRH